jgi:hypothetical protein
LDRKLGEPQSQSERSGEEKNSYSTASNRTGLGKNKSADVGIGTNGKMWFGENRESGNWKNKQEEV